MKMTLTGITWDHPRGYTPLIASSVLYEQTFGIKVKWEKRSLTNFGDQSLAGLAERYDLLIIDHPQIGIAFETHCLFPLNELLARDKINTLKNETAGPCFSSYHYKESQWAIPIDAAMQCSAYRPDLVIDLAIPNNLKEVFDLTKLLKKQNLRIGMALCPTDCLCTFLTLTAQLGSPIQEGNELLVSREIGLHSLELMRQMRNEFDQRSLKWNPIQLYDYMSTHNDIAYAPLAFCYTNYSRDGFRKHKLRYCNAPGISNSVLGGAGIAVSAKSKFAKEAGQYTTWISSAEIQSSVYLMAQGQPANIVAWKSDLGDKLADNFFKSTFETLMNAFVRPRYSGWPKFQKYLGEVLHTFLENHENPVFVLDHLQDSYRRSYYNQ
jgi:multiple sugar transport system substrate-binding protein